MRRRSSHHPPRVHQPWKPDTASRVKPTVVMDVESCDPWLSNPDIPVTSSHTGLKLNTTVLLTMAVKTHSVRGDLVHH